jgi:hypothetical protein
LAGADLAAGDLAADDLAAEALAAVALAADALGGAAFADAAFTIADLADEAFAGAFPAALPTAFAAAVFDLSALPFPAPADALAARDLFFGDPILGTPVCPAVETGPRQGRPYARPSSARRKPGLSRPCGDPVS